MQTGGMYGIIIKHDCDRYALKREVAAQYASVFPWSMSDFKPGDKYFEYVKGFIMCLFALRRFEPAPGFRLKAEIRFFIWV